MYVLILPTRREFSAAVGHWKDKTRVDGYPVPAWRVDELLILRCGMGPEGARQAVAAMEEIQPTTVWLFGWCGGLRPDLQCGDIVVSTETVDDAGLRMETLPDPRIRQVLDRLASDLGQRCAVGKTLSLGYVLHDKSESPFPDDDSLLSVEMEAQPIARWAQVSNGVVFNHVRFVLDPVAQALPGGRPAAWLNLPQQMHSLYRFTIHARHVNRVMRQAIDRLRQEGCFAATDCSQEITGVRPVIGCVED